MGRVQIPLSALRKASFEPCEEVLLSSRPVIFENEIQTTPEEQALYYGVKGTSFVFRLENIFYVATAKHVIKDTTDCPYDNVCILISAASRIFFPLNQANKAEDIDLLVFRIDSALLEKEHPAPFPFYHFQNPLKTAGLKEGATVYTRGFPSFNNWVDYQTLTVKNQGLFLRGTVKGDPQFSIRFRIEWHKQDIDFFLHEPSFGNNFCIDGMSGSPVFHADNCAFAGIMTNGGLTCGHALYNYVLFNIFRQL
jgi:hypothetical protein